VIILANEDFLVNSFGENILNLSDPLSSAKVSSHRTDRAEGVIMHISEESAAAVRKTVKRHQGNRFFALCHIAASLLSHTVFLPKL
jgi:hypothetical protein